MVTRFVLTLLIGLVVIFNDSSAILASDLPQCSKWQDKSRWNNCVGTRTFTNGKNVRVVSHYVGEFKEGYPHGQGTLTYRLNTDGAIKGDQYVGAFKLGKFHGQGTFNRHDGKKVVGEWRDDLIFRVTHHPPRFLGISMKNLTPETAKTSGLSKSRGVLVTSVIQGAGAQRAGIQVGDIILSFETKVVKNSMDLIGFIAKANLGKKLKLELLRQGNTKVATVILGKVGSSTQAASAPKAKPKVTSAALTAAEKEAERLRQELASLKAKQQRQQQTISSDTKLPMITIASASTRGKQGIIRGRARDNTGIAEVTVGGRPVPFDASGNFKFETFVPADGKEVTIQVTDLNGLSNSKTVKLDRTASNTMTAITFESLNPLGRKVAKNKDALALIIGVDGYENTPARAIYADSDAKVFADYANEKLGIPSNRIKTLVNNGADEKGMLLAVKDWLSRASKKDKSDVYVFFAGHGLASDNGEKMYLLPYDGSPRLLDDTAILRDRLFSDIASANPRSVTVFLDTCYSGTTRGTDMLIASRPIAIKALEQSIPDNFTVMTAAAGDQTAKPLKEAKHGMFSYFLMKGMEGEADKNQDNKITAGELHQYVQSNVVQQSSGSQTPELQGDAKRILVRFQ